MKKTIATLSLVLFGAFSVNVYSDSLPALSPIEAGESCHVCGMIVTNFPGPKGQAKIKHNETTLKFCSTADLFTWLLQPETPAMMRSAYVHDMGAASATWDKPSEKDYVDAKKAWYVVGGDQMGAMGATLASFREKAAAEQYMKQHGGMIKRFADIDLELMANLQKPMMKEHSMPMQHQH